SSRTPPGRSGIWTSGSAAGCGRSAGRNGSSPRARRANLRRLGINESFSHQWGNSSKGYWRIAGSPVLQRALPNTYWDDLGLLTLKPTWQRLRSAR
ncbi:hypothetical protein, partial [Streptomyces sp. NPDC001978]|uniref:hypothetical protein n=1 Tax=Streptomyces sp. NPDC001978 TaxID=3364627 RepID=UPI0036B213D1